MELSDMRYEQLKEQDYEVAQEMLKQDIESGEELLRTLSSEPELLMATFLNDKLVALAQVEKDTPRSYLIVFVDPQFRRKGIGSRVVKYVEEMLRVGGTQAIMSSFHASNNPSLTFARKFGYNKRFSSAFMQ